MTFKPFFASGAGGKTRQLPQILPLIPNHSIYIEPFVGAGTVFFAKPPVAVEHLNDFDPDIALAYKSAQEITDADLDSLRAMDWIPSKQRFSLLKARDSTHPLGHLRKFLYIKNASGFHQSRSFTDVYGTLRDSSMDRVVMARLRLADVEITNCDALECLQPYKDIPEAFIYLDPPYPGCTIASQKPRLKDLYFSYEHLSQLLGYLRGFKGKFLMSVDGTEHTRDLCKEFTILDVQAKRSGGNWRGKAVAKTEGAEILVMNYS